MRPANGPAMNAMPGNPDRGTLRKPLRLLDARVAMETLMRNRLLSGWLIAAVLLQLLLIKIPLWRCPLHATTGLPCPGCGLTRGVLAWLRWDTVGMMSYHPFAPFVIWLGALTGVAWILRGRWHDRFVDAVLNVEAHTLIHAILLLTFVLYGTGRLIMAMAHALLH